MSKIVHQCKSKVNCPKNKNWRNHDDENSQAERHHNCRTEWKIVGPATPELRKVLSPQIMASDPPRILINLAQVNKIDSSGLGGTDGGTCTHDTQEGTYRGRQRR